MSRSHGKAQSPQGGGRSTLSPSQAPPAKAVPGHLWAALSTFRPVVLAAPKGVLRRSPFDNESATDRARREALLQSIDNARDRILEMLRTGGLLENFEVPVERAGVRGVVYDPTRVGTADEEFISYTARHALLRRLVRSLQALGTRYRSAPIPAEFGPPTEEPEAPGDYTSSSIEYDDPEHGHMHASYGGSSPEYADLQAAYARYRIARGEMGSEFDSDWYYLDPTARIVRYAARGAPRLGGGIPSGAYMVFPDVDADPLNYFRLDGYTPIPEGSVIIEFWHDDLGYYYMNHGRRIDVPSPWR